MVNVTVDHAYANYHIEAFQAQEQEKIESTLKESNFRDLLRLILHDMILYGSSFMQMIPKDQILTLKRLKPQVLIFRIDWVQEPPRRSYFQKIVEIKRFDDPSIKYDIDDCLHFKVGLTVCEPIGESILGFWFTTWYFLRDLPEMVPLLDMRGAKYSSLKEFRDFKESGVLGAAGIPHSLIFPWMQTPPSIMKIEQQRFQHDIERRRNTISRVVERQLFPRILGRNYDYDNFPRLVFS
ncbi:MAG: hypothetical protein OEX01_01205 [Candidatus Bathyarchaeota archaeon]|nr:hypothetical protein [Candidatus Bathyarchaeota archaeon]